MAILNFTLSTVGQSGQVPSFIFIETNDSVGTVSAAGYLNHLVAQGNQLNANQMAVVSTKASQTDPPVVGFYNVGHYGGNWTLTPVTSGGGDSFSPANSYNSDVPAGPITGDWQFKGAFTVQAGTGDVLLKSDTGTITLQANNPGEFAKILGDFVEIDANTSASITASSLTIETTGETSLTSQGEMTLTGQGGLTLSPGMMGAVKITGLTNVVPPKPYVVYYDDVDGKLSYASNGFAEDGDYTLTGSWQFNGPSFNVAASSGDITIQSLAGSLNLLANTAAKQIAVQSPTVGVLATTAFNSTAGSSFLQTTGSGAFSIAAGGILSLQGAGGINLPTLANATTANVIYYNSSTGYMTYGAAPAAGGIAQNNVTATTQTMAVNNGYITNAASLLTYTLPSTAAVGTIVEVTGNSASGWIIAQNAGQNIQVGTVSSTVGTGGSVASQNRYDCMTLICTVANTTFVAKAQVSSGYTIV